MELRKRGCDFCAFTQELPSIALQRGEEIVNRAINISTKLTTTALDVFRVWAIDANMHTVPSAMATLGTSRTTLMGTQILAFLFRSQSSSPFLGWTPRRGVVWNQPEFSYEFFVPCLAIEKL